MSLRDYWTGIKSIKSVEQVGKIIQGKINRFTGQNTEIAQARLAVCTTCPLFQNGFCSKQPEMIPQLVIQDNPEAKAGTKRVGCGCLLADKVTLPGAWCPLGKWMPVTESSFYKWTTLIEGEVKTTQLAINEVRVLLSIFGQYNFLHSFDHPWHLTLPNSNLMIAIKARLAAIGQAVTTAIYHYSIEDETLTEESEVGLMSIDSQVIVVNDHELAMEAGHIYWFSVKVELSNIKFKHLIILR